MKKNKLNKNLNQESAQSERFKFQINCFFPRIIYFFLFRVQIYIIFCDYLNEHGLKRVGIY